MQIKRCNYMLCKFWCCDFFKEWFQDMKHLDSSLLYVANKMRERERERESEREREKARAKDNENCMVLDDARISGKKFLFFMFSLGIRL